MAENILSPVFAISFPTLFKAKPYGNGEPKYSATMLFTPAAAALQKALLAKNPKARFATLDDLRNLAHAAAAEKWGPDYKKRMKVKMPFHDGEEKEHLDGYEPGVVFVPISSKNRPTVVDRRRAEITDADEVYPGCFCTALINAYAWEHPEGGKGVSFGMQHVQKLKDGDRLGSSAPPADDAFDEFEDDEDDGSDLA